MGFNSIPPRLQALCSVRGGVSTMSRLFIILLTVNNQDIAAVQLLLASDRPHKEPQPRLNRSTLCKLLWSCWRPFMTEDDRRSCSMKLLINSPRCFSSAGLMSVGAGECWNANGCFYVRVRLRLCIVLRVDTRHVGAKQFVHWLGLKKKQQQPKCCLWMRCFAFNWSLHLPLFLK